jgi:hypothetical protein
MEKLYNRKTNGNEKEKPRRDFSPQSFSTYIDKLRGVTGTKPNGCFAKN